MNAHCLTNGILFSPSVCYQWPAIAAPTLVYFSDDDPIASPTPCLAVIDKWRAKGIDVRYHHWPVSEHVQHLRRHTDEYLAGFDGFLGDILTPRQGLGSS